MKQIHDIIVSIITNSRESLRFSIRCFCKMYRVRKITKCFTSKIIVGIDMLLYVWTYFSLQDGMQREIFQKLVVKLEEHCELLLVGSEIDYRRFIAERSIDKVKFCLQLALLLKFNVKTIYSFKNVSNSYLWTCNSNPSFNAINLYVFNNCLVVSLTIPCRFTIFGH